MPHPKRCLVTGGAGFVGSALSRLLLGETDAAVLVVDRLTYAGTPCSLKEVGLDPATLVSSNPRLSFLNADVCDSAAMNCAFASFRPDSVFHLAAESHVDRSIDAPDAFIRTNVAGTAALLQAALAFWRGLDDAARSAFRFLHVSTDEVYGSLGKDGLFTESSPYAPRSPYAASKAASDHLVRAWRHTYGLPTIVTNCSNNYGPRQFPEKLIPLAILNCLESKPVSIYGSGENVRDWLFVEDHARALLRVCECGSPGQTYNIGGRCERTNVQTIAAVCATLDELRPRRDGAGYASLVTHVADRPGHDMRYAIDPGKISRELGWRPQTDFDTGIRKTVKWYLENEWWWRPLRENVYHGQRIGRGRSPMRTDVR